MIKIAEKFSENIKILIVLNCVRDEILITKINYVILRKSDYSIKQLDQ